MNIGFRIATKRPPCLPKAFGTGSEGVPNQLKKSPLGDLGVVFDLKLSLLKLYSGANMRNLESEYHQR